MTTVNEFLRVKYGVLRPTTMTATDAALMGIEYPLTPGWLDAHGDRPLTPLQVEHLIARLQAQIANRERELERAATPKRTNTVAVRKEQLERLAERFPEAVRAIPGCDSHFRGKTS